MHVHWPSPSRSQTLAIVAVLALAIVAGALWFATSEQGAALGERRSGCAQRRAADDERAQPARSAASYGSPLASLRGRRPEPRCSTMSRSPGRRALLLPRCHRRYLVGRDRHAGVQAQRRPQRTACIARAALADRRAARRHRGAGHCQRAEPLARDAARIPLHRCDRGGTHSTLWRSIANGARCAAS